MIFIQTSQSPQTGSENLNSLQLGKKFWNTLHVGSLTNFLWEESTFRLPEKLGINHFWASHFLWLCMVSLFR